jgi:sarcosine/dimethylglycine N-methyltransferase
MGDKQDSLVDITRNYYDSKDADSFYYHVWGGEDIHVGLYLSASDSIKDASRQTVQKMAETINSLNSNSKVLDIGAGYGGAARYLADQFGCQVDCLNLSETENQRNIQKNKEIGLDDKISVHYGNFEEMPFPDNSYDIIWCQDAILHSDNKPKVIREVSRLLKKGGEFIFTDPMQGDDTEPTMLQPVLDRIHLKELGSVKKYRNLAQQNGLKEISVNEMPEKIPTHYSRVLKEMESRESELIDAVSPEYIANMKKGLKNWVKFGNEGHLNWAIMHFKKE